MQKAAALKILNIYTFTLNSLHMQLSKGQPEHVCVNPQLLCTNLDVVKTHGVEHPK